MGKGYSRASGGRPAAQPGENSECGEGGLASRYIIVLGASCKGTLSSGRAISAQCRVGAGRTARLKCRSRPAVPTLTAGSHGKDHSQLPAAWGGASPTLPPHPRPLCPQFLASISAMI